MISSYIVHAPNNAATAVTRYISIQTSNNATLQTVVSESVMPMAGTFQNLYIQVGAAYGAGNQIVFTITKNGINQATTVTIAGGTQVTGNDILNTFAFNAGDTIGIQMVGTGTPTATNLTWGFEVSGTGQALLTGDPSTVASNSATSYFVLQGSATSASAPVANGSVAPTAGTIANAYMTLSAAPGGVGKIYTATLVKNGTPTSLIVAISNAATTGSDLTGGDAVTVAAGDTFYWQIVPTSTPTAAKIFVSAQFTPTTDGESMHTFVSTTNLAVSGNNFTGPGNGTMSTTEKNRVGTIGSVATLSKLYWVLGTAPGGATSYTATVRQALANTSPAVTSTITGAATTGNDTTHTSGATTAGDWVGMNIVGASTPLASLVTWGFVSYIVPVVTGTSSRMMSMGMG